MVTDENADVPRGPLPRSGDPPPVFFYFLCHQNRKKNRLLPPALEAPFFSGMRPRPPIAGVGPQRGRLVPNQRFFGPPRVCRPLANRPGKKTGPGPPCCAPPKKALTLMWCSACPLNDTTVWTKGNVLWVGLRRPNAPPFGVGMKKFGAVISVKYPSAPGLAGRVFFLVPIKPGPVLDPGGGEFSALKKRSPTPWPGGRSPPRKRNCPPPPTEFRKPPFLCRPPSIAPACDGKPGPPPKVVTPNQPRPTRRPPGPNGPDGWWCLAIGHGRPGPRCFPARHVAARPFARPVAKTARSLCLL